MVSVPAVDIPFVGALHSHCLRGCRAFFCAMVERNKQNHVSRKEFAARIDVASALLLKGWTKRRVTKKLREDLNLPRATAERAVTIAAKRLLSLSDRTSEEMIGLCAEHLLRIINDQNSEPAPRVSALKELARLFGLSKTQVEVTHHSAPELTREEKAAVIMREIALAKAKASGHN